MRFGECLRHRPAPTSYMGLGEIGKTQFALEYAYRHALEYGAVFWIIAQQQADQ